MLALGLLVVLAQPNNQDTVHGTVSRVDIDRAEIVVQTDAEPPSGRILITGPGVHIDRPGTTAQPARELTLKARPIDVATLKAGDSLDFTTESWNGVLWLAPSEPLSPQSAFDGVVDDVNTADGNVIVAGQMVHGFPRQLDDVRPGDRVHVQFALLGSSAWVSSISPMGAGPAAPIGATAETGTGTSGSGTGTSDTGTGTSDTGTGTGTGTSDTGTGTSTTGLPPALPMWPQQVLPQQMSPAQQMLSPPQLSQQQLQQMRTQQQQGAQQGARPGPMGAQEQGAMQPGQALPQQQGVQQGAPQMLPVQQGVQPSSPPSFQREVQQASPQQQMQQQMAPQQPGPTSPYWPTTPATPTTPTTTTPTTPTTVTPTTPGQVAPATPGAVQPAATP